MRLLLLLILLRLVCTVVVVLYTEIEIPNDYNLYNYIFSFGDEAEVLEPEEVRMQIKKMINKMAEKYII